MKNNPQDMFTGLLKKCFDKEGDFHILKMLYDMAFLEDAYTECFAEFASESFKQLEGIAGIGRKGGYLGSCVAQTLKKPFISVNPIESTPEREASKIRESRRFCSARKLVLVDDTLTSGNSFEMSKALLDTNGFSVLGEVILVWDDIHGIMTLAGKPIKYVFRLSELKKI